MELPFSGQLLSVWRYTFVTTIWSIWFARNQLCFQNVVIPATSTAAFILSSVKDCSSTSLGPLKNRDDFYILHRLGIRTNPYKSLIVSPVRWFPPLLGWIKANVDRSSRGQPGPSSCGGLFRNSRGFVLGCFSCLLGTCFSFESELVACMTAIECASLRGWNRLWLELDSSYVVRLLSQRSNLVPWNHRNRWLACLRFLESISFCVSHIYREGNQPADRLASMATSSFTWWSTSPPQIVSLVSLDFHGPGYYRFH